MKLLVKHRSDVTWVPERLEWPETAKYAQQLVQDNIKEIKQIAGLLWIPLTEGQQMLKIFPCHDGFMNRKRNILLNVTMFSRRIQIIMNSSLECVEATNQTSLSIWLPKLCGKCHTSDAFFVSIFQTFRDHKTKRDE